MDQYGSPVAARNLARSLELFLSNPAVVAPILSEGWADEADLERGRAAVVAWGERPDAFCAWMYCAAVGWVGDAE